MKKFNFYFSFFLLMSFSQVGIAQIGHDFSWIIGTHHGTTGPFAVNDCAQSLTLDINNGNYFPQNNPQTQDNGSIVLDWTDNFQTKIITISFGAAVSNPSIRIGDLDDNGMNPPDEFINQFAATPSGVTWPLQLTNGSTAVVPTGNNQDGWISWTGNYTSISFTYNRPGNGFGLHLDSITYSCSCCDGKNLVTNGDFENGNSGFSSDYSLNAQLSPSQYFVTDHSGATASCPQWDLVGASSCSTTDNFLLVNGLTNQPAGSTSVVWRQVVPDIKGGDYELCLDLKNLPSCCFDINPVLIINIGNTQFTHIIQAGNNPCDWQKLSIPISLTDASNIPISIALQEGALGDGNDFAIDNIHFHRLDDELYFTLHQNNQHGLSVLASIREETTGDDALPDGCQHHWEILDQTGALLLSQSNWGTTTTFPPFQFTPNTFYLIQLTVDSCDCFNNNKTMSIAAGLFLKKGKYKLIIKKGKEFGHNHNIQNNNDIIIRPNPASDIVNIELESSSPIHVTLFGSDGNLIFSKKISNKQIDISTVPKGIYSINITTDKLNITKKLVVQ